MNGQESDGKGFLKDFCTTTGKYLIWFYTGCVVRVEGTDIVEHITGTLVLPPNATPERLRMMRHMIACQLESARAMRARAPFGADMLLRLTVHGMLQFKFWSTNQYLPDNARLLAELDELDHDLCVLAQRFAEEADPAERWFLAEEIADRTIQMPECVEPETSATPE
jgi:hypothetical protein